MACWMLRMRATRRQAGSGSATARRVLGGTVMYASPEQCKHILGDQDIVELDGRTSSLIASPDIADATLPETSFTAEAWVRIDEPLEWGGVRVVDLDGRTAIPGFTEGHAHFTGIGRSLMNVDLRAARSWDEIVATMAAVAIPARIARGNSPENSGLPLTRE